MHKEAIDIVENFFSNYTLRSYKKGQVLILDDEGPNQIFYLVSGRVKVYDISYRGDEIILNSFGPGAAFPVALLVNKSRNRYIYEAASDITIRQAPSNDVVTFLKNEPQVMYYMLSEIYTKLDDILGRMSHLMASSAKRRLIYELLLECKHFGIKQSDGRHELTVTEKDIGARAGLSRETVSREINKLKREKLVAVEHNVISITSLPDLEWRHAHTA